MSGAHLPLRKPCHVVARPAHGIYKLLDVDPAVIKEYRSLTAVEVNLNFMNPRQSAKCFLNCQITFMAMHTFNSNQH